MDIEMEKKIARAFIYKNKRERFLFEMANKNRSDAIHRLEKTIDKSFSVMQSTKFPPPAQLIQTMTEYGAGKMCYVISEDYEDFDGVYIELYLAVEKLRWNGFSSLIVGLPSGFSHLKLESYASWQPNMFLKPTIRFDNVPW